MMTQYSVYKITNLINGKCYIGWTSRSPLIRIREHQTYQKAPISQAIKKYGVEHFENEVLLTTEDLNLSQQTETRLIQEHNSLINQHGYNQDLGGVGKKRSQATIDKHRSAMIGKKQTPEHIAKRKSCGAKNGSFGKMGELSPRFGTYHTEETKAKISKTNTGLRKGIKHGPHTEATKAKISASKRGRSQTPEHIAKRVAAHTGTHQPESQKQKVAAALAKSYTITDPEGKVFEITNLTAFARERGLNQANLTRVAQGYNKSCKGYLVKYSVDK